MRTKEDPDFQDPDGALVSGHSGNGCAKIKIISSSAGIISYQTLRYEPEKRPFNHNVFFLAKELIFRFHRLTIPLINYISFQNISIPKEQSS